MSGWQKRRNPNRSRWQKQIDTIFSISGLLFCHQDRGNKILSVISRQLSYTASHSIGQLPYDHCCQNLRSRKSQSIIFFQAVHILFTPHSMKQIRNSATQETSYIMSLSYRLSLPVVTDLLMSQTFSAKTESCHLPSCAFSN